MSLQGRKKRVNRSGERELVCNVYKFIKSESEVGITIPLSKVQKRVAEATHCCIRCGPDEERILDVVPREDGARNSG